MNLKLSRTALRELTRLYRGVLVAALISAAFVASGAKAETITETVSDQTVTKAYNFISGGSTVDIIDSTYTNNANTNGTGSNSSFGAAVFSEGSTVNITNSTFTGNTSAYVGGAAGTNQTGTLNVTGSTFSNNHAHYDGGAIGNYGALDIQSSTFTGNTAHYDKDGNGDYTIAVADSMPVGGGAISLGAESATKVGSIIDTTFTNNKSGTNGGAIGTRLAANADNSAARLDIDATFTGNYALKNGGAI